MLTYYKHRPAPSMHAHQETRQAPVVQGGQKVADQAKHQDLGHRTACKSSYHHSAVKLSIREKSSLCSPCGPVIRYHWTSQTFLINQIRSDFIGQLSKYTRYRFVLLGQLSSARLTRSALHTPPKYALSDQNRPDLHSSTCLQSWSSSTQVLPNL